MALRGFLNIIIRMAKIGEYIKDTAAEMRHVSWPSRTQAINYTLLVIGISVFAAVFMYIFDELFLFLLRAFVLKS